MYNLNFEQNISQVLRLYLTPKLIQTLRILSLPYTDMVEEIEKASEENPFIEIEQHDKLTEYLTYLESDRKIRKEVDFKELPGLEKVSLPSGVDLRSFLLEQLKLVDIPDNQKIIAEKLINEIDPHGYLKEFDKLKSLIIESDKVPAVLVDKTLEIIQGFEPEGVGSRDVKECLLIQLAEYGFDNEVLQELIEKAIKNHLEDIADKNFKKVADELGIDEAGVEELVNFIKQNLNPYPAANFGEEAQQIIPSFAIETIKDEVRLVNLEEKYGPKVGLSADYQKMLKTDAETVKFLREKLEKAKEMLEDLQKRGETSSAIMNIIMETQKEFFEKGPAFLLPLEQKELASRLGLHPSTISRAISGKYVQTPKGLIPIKILCPRQFKGFTPQAIKAKMLDIISDEDKRKPLSDDQIKDMLSQNGVTIERRTIASYRKELGIISASERMAL